jgi:UDP-3-O-[3-hydroxymyristoyl] glucosamine N-acyltransferase
MRPSPRLPALLAALLLAAPAQALDTSGCRVDVGPEDRVSRGETLVIRGGERVENAVALHGDLIVESGAVVASAVAVGGSLTLRPGARVKEDAVAIGGDLRIEGDARVGNDAVSLGGQVTQDDGASVRGSVVGLAVWGGSSWLARQLLKGVAAVEGCRVVTKSATGS